MVDIIIVAQAILQMHIIVDGSQDIFLGNMLGYQFMYVLLDCFCQLLGIIAELFQDLCQNRIVYQFMDTEILGIAIYIRSTIRLDSTFTVLSSVWIYTKGTALFWMVSASSAVTLSPADAITSPVEGSTTSAARI